ncbi:hypothetical protein J7394_19020 [Ruegeria sp. R13_0]|uniref:ATP-grasp fold amidoligase family protein n=1 Tax=Ruegeria sp. R13_0 TaxID=2821099 RepID=UPI001ADACD21|nr:ATP-grasp fold amidoligase family protein [Ruegeria sp. R13_0]MBO9436318.1 hypothetical protein [Ruegeria sp. R13_0]
MNEKKPRPRFREMLPDLPPLATPPAEIIAAFPDMVTARDVRRLDLFLRYSEYLLFEIRRHKLFGIANPPRANFTRGYDYYPSDAARIFALATSINRFSQNHGYPPNFLDPKTATEKLLVMKMFGEIPIGPPADKLMTELFVPDAVLPLLSLTRRSWIATKPGLPVNTEMAPGRYFLKTNFGAGNNVAVQFPMDDEAREALLKKQTTWFARRHRHGFWAGEWWYHTISPRVFVEEDLADGGQDIDDWKLWVLAGRVHIVQVDQDRSTQHVQRIYDRDFNLLADELYYPSDPSPGRRPSQLDDMVRVAEAIGRDLEFARVDFFIRGQNLYLGEITLCPFGAKKKMRSADLDRDLGKAWTGTRLFPNPIREGQN